MCAGSQPLEGIGDGPDGWGHREGLAKGRGPHAARCLSRLRGWKTLVCLHLSICSLRFPAEALPPSPRRTGGPRAGAEARGSKAPGASKQQCRNMDAGLWLCCGAHRPASVLSGLSTAFSRSACQNGLPTRGRGILQGMESPRLISAPTGDTRLPPRLLGCGRTLGGGTAGSNGDSVFFQEPLHCPLGFPGGQW